MNEKAKDIAYSLIKGSIGSAPVLGALAAEVFGLLITPPLEKRRRQWMNEIAEKLAELERKGAIDFNQLKDNEQFVDAVLNVTSLALKTCRAEKIKAFQNIILNTATANCPDETISQIFINELDKFTTWHIELLIFIDSPINWYESKDRQIPKLMSGSIHSLLMDAYPELRGNDELLNIIWNDLYEVGFHKTSGLKTTMTWNGVIEPKITDFGKSFLGFIKFND